MEKIYDFVVVGGGISGSSVVYELTQKSNGKVLLIDKLSNIASGASGAAGAFLSPLLGKPNRFKDLVTRALKYTSKLYRNSFINVIDSCGTTRIPKSIEDKEKFEEYKPYIDFPYKQTDDGYFFNIGTVVNSFGICKMMTMSFSNIKKNLDTLFNYEVTDISYDKQNQLWIVNDEIKTKELILTTGASLELLDEFYLKVRAVWGRRLDIQTSTKLDHNYHKECSISKSFPISDNLYKVSIGATHKRTLEDVEDAKVNNEELLKKARDILDLDDLEITKEYVGARSCSVDYFPMVGSIIDSKKTLELFPYLKDGTHVPNDRFVRYPHLHILNGVGGRGFVLAPYLANRLVENILFEKEYEDEIKVDRLFLREVKRRTIPC